MTTQNKALKVLPNDLIDELLAGYQKPEDLIGENGLLKQLTKALVKRPASRNDRTSRSR